MDDCLSDSSAGSSAWIFLYDPVPYIKSLIATIKSCSVWVQGYITSVETTFKVYKHCYKVYKHCYKHLYKHWPTLIVSVVFLINLGTSSPKTNLGCPPCGKDKC